MIAQNICKETLKEVLKLAKIYCGVTNCEYNKQEICNIEQIEVNSNSNEPQVTEVVNCMTFKPKE